MQIINLIHQIALIRDLHSKDMKNIVILCKTNEFVFLNWIITFTTLYFSIL